MYQLLKNSEKLTQYLERVCIAPCDVCGGTEFSILMNDQKEIDIVSNVSIAEEKNILSTDFLLSQHPTKLIQIRCNTCGQVKYFSYDIVVKNILRLQRDALHEQRHEN